MIARLAPTFFQLLLSTCRRGPTPYVPRPPTLWYLVVHGCYLGVYCDAAPIRVLHVRPQPLHARVQRQQPLQPPHLRLPCDRRRRRRRLAAAWPPPPRPPPPLLMVVVASPPPPLLLLLLLMSVVAMVAPPPPCATEAAHASLLESLGSNRRQR